MLCIPYRNLRACVLIRYLGLLIASRVKIHGADVRAESARAPDCLRSNAHDVAAYAAQQSRPDRTATR